MKIKLCGKNPGDIREVLEKFGMSDCGNGKPELIVTYGGDGAMLGAVREFPGTLILPLRDEATAPTCALHRAEKILEDFVSGRLPRTALPKLTAESSAGKVSGINDLVIHNLEYSSALRYRVFINGRLYAKEVVGDGVCFAGVHGSTAYYRSITRGIFQVGVGLAFSNSTEVVDHLVLPESSEVMVEILRGPGVLMADNDPQKLRIEVGDKVILRQSDELVEIAGLAEFMCQECRFLRHHLLSANEERH